MNDFIKKWLGKKAYRPPFSTKGSKYEGQCVQLFRCYLDYLGATQFPSVKGAADLATKYPKDEWQPIQSITEAQEGDVVIWPRDKSMPYGHVGMYYMQVAEGEFDSFDSNWQLDQTAHIESHLIINGLIVLRYAKLGNVDEKLKAEYEKTIRQLNTEIGEDHKNFDRIRDAAGASSSKIDAILKAINDKSKDVDNAEAKASRYKKKYEQAMKNKFETIDLLKEVLARINPMK